jgi:hypothetical protein
MSARRTTEPSAKLLREIAIMVKAAGVADLADRLACACQRAAPKKTPGVIQSKRIYETAAGGASLREELLEIVQGNARFGCDVTRAKVRIGEAVLDDRADTTKLFVCVVRDGL